MENETKKALYDAATADFPQLLSCVPDEFKTQEMCNQAAAENPEMLEYVPEKFKTQEIKHRKCAPSLYSNFLLLKGVKTIALLYGSYTLCRVLGDVIQPYIQPFRTIYRTIYFKHTNVYSD